MDGRPSVFRRREGVKDLHVHVYYHVLTRNFFVYYEIDNDESKHALALSEHGYLTATTVRPGSHVTAQSRRRSDQPHQPPRCPSA